MQLLSASRKSCAECSLPCLLSPRPLHRVKAYEHACPGCGAAFPSPPFAGPAATRFGSGSSGRDTLPVLDERGLLISCATDTLVGGGFVRWQLLPATSPVNSNNTLQRSTVGTMRSISSSRTALAGSREKLLHMWSVHGSSSSEQGSCIVQTTALLRTTTSSASSVVSSLFQVPQSSRTPLLHARRQPPTPLTLPKSPRVQSNRFAPPSPRMQQSHLLSFAVLGDTDLQIFDIASTSLPHKTLLSLPLARIKVLDRQVGAAPTQLRLMDESNAQIIVLHFDSATHRRLWQAKLQALTAQAAKAAELPSAPKCISTSPASTAIPYVHYPSPPPQSQHAAPVPVPSKPKRRPHISYLDPDTEFRSSMPAAFRSDDDDDNHDGNDEDNDEDHVDGDVDKVRSVQQYQPRSIAAEARERSAVSSRLCNTPTSSSQNKTRSVGWRRSSCSREQESSFVDMFRFLRTDIRQS
ncbi:hypothetical protein RI367_007416 [Sorochytrium milnesiophthora]